MVLYMPCNILHLGIGKSDSRSDLIVTQTDEKQDPVITVVQVFIGSKFSSNVRERTFLEQVKTGTLNVTNCLGHIYSSVVCAVRFAPASASAL